MSGSESERQQARGRGNRPCVFHCKVRKRERRCGWAETRRRGGSGAGAASPRYRVTQRREGRRQLTPADPPVKAAETNLQPCAYVQSRPMRPIVPWLWRSPNCGLRDQAATPLGWRRPPAAPRRTERPVRWPATCGGCRLHARRRLQRHGHCADDPGGPAALITRSAATVPVAFPCSPMMISAPATSPSISPSTSERAPADDLEVLAGS